MTAPRTEAPAQRARCRHCGNPIYFRPPGKFWADEAGIPGCIKGVLKPPDYPGQPGGAVAAPPVMHQPMPEGLDGAPQPMESA
jgi:hypothetical protein